jgi:branched-chain amino acid transport system ATP-binding protein
VLARLNAEEGLTVLVVEQIATLALRTAHRAFVLETGRVVLAGPAEELREHESIRRSYLGY